MSRGGQRHNHFLLLVLMTKNSWKILEACVTGCRLVIICAFGKSPGFNLQVLYVTLYNCSWSVFFFIPNQVEYIVYLSSESQTCSNYNQNQTAQAASMQRYQGATPREYLCHLTNTYIQYMVQKTVPF